MSSDDTKAFPRLSKLPIGVLSIPASSSSTERAFSVTGNVLFKKHLQLSSSTVDAIVVLHS